MVWGIRPPFDGLSPSDRQVAYALLTRAPVASYGIATILLPLDLHGLGLSLAFILSQDQTLRCMNLFLTPLGSNGFLEKIAGSSPLLFPLCFCLFLRFQCAYALPY